MVLVVAIIAFPQGLVGFAGQVRSWIQARMRPSTTVATAADGEGVLVLAVDDLRVSFGGVRAVDGVSLTVAEGTTLGLVGPNGSGKSTFLNGVCGFVTVSGQVTVGGERLRLGRPLDGCVVPASCGPSRRPKWRPR